MKKVGIFVVWVLLCVFQGYSQDFQKIYIDFMKMYDAGDYVRAFRVLDDTISRYEKVPDYFYVKLFDVLDVGYSSGKFSYAYLTNTLYRYYGFLISRGVYSEFVWERFVLVADNYDLPALFYEGLKNLFFVNPSNENGLFSLVRKLFTEKNYYEVVNIYNNGLREIRSPSIAYLILLSKIYEQDYSDFDNVLKLVAYNYDSDDIRYVVSSVYYSLMDFDNAWEILMLSRNPDPDLRLKLMVLRGENPKKINSFILENRGRLNEDLVEFVNVVLKGGKEYTAELENRLLFGYEVESLQIGLAFRFPKNSRIYRLGMEKAIVGFFSKKMYREVVKFAENYPKKSRYIKLLLGISYFQLGDYRKAFSLLKELENSFFHARIRLPFIYLKLGMKKEAVRKARALMKEVQYREDIFKYLLGKVFLEVRDFESFDKIMSRVKSTNHYFYGLLHSYKLFSEKKYAECESLLVKLLEMYPFNSEIMNSLAYVWAEQNKNLIEALKLSKFSLVFEEDYSYLDTLAYVYYRLNDLENARKAIEKSISIMEKKKDFSKTVYLRAAMIYKSLGDKEKSRVMVVKANRGRGL